MEKKESIKAQDIKNQSLDGKNLKKSSTSKIKKEKSLPWWVELLFVQIGLPDKWLVKILKSKKNSSDFIKNEKKIILFTLFFFLALVYFLPIVKYSKAKLDCEKVAKKYLTENKNLVKIDNKKLRMLSTNFCNGGEEIYEIENIKR